LKFIDCYGDNSNVDLGTIGIIGTLDCSKSGILLGPIAHTFGVLKWPLALVNFFDQDGEQIINQIINYNKCIIFYTNMDVLFIEQVAAAVKERMITFKVIGSDE